MYFSGGDKLYVSPHLLCQSPKLESLYLDNTLELLDVSKDAGHVLVHHLITGTYQSLKLMYLGPEQELAAEFLTSVRVYTAAKTYSLPSLVELAKAEIERLGERLQVSLAFDLMRDAYPNPDTDDVWLNSYLKNRLKLFLEDGFTDTLVDEVAVRRNAVSVSDILFKSLLELLRDNAVSPHEEFNGPFEKAKRDVPTAQPVPVASEERPAELKTGEQGWGNGNVIDSSTWLAEIKEMVKTADLVSELPEKVDPKDVSLQDIGVSPDKTNEIDPMLMEQPKEKEKERLKSKKGKKGKKKYKSNFTVVDPLPEPPEDYPMVKPQHETENENDKGNGDDLQGCHGPTSMIKEYEMNAPTVISSIINPAVGSWSIVKFDGGKKNQAEDEGRDIWGFGGKKREIDIAF